MIAKLKQDGVMPIVEGKQPTSFKRYKLLATKALEQCKDHNLAIFSHLYLLLCWNLIARCVSVGSLMYNHPDSFSFQAAIRLTKHVQDQVQ
jgi:hypothetical protein